MATVRNSLVGKNVYGGVSQSANVGRVSGKGAQGYLQREIRKNPIVRPVGSDGKSDRRSGVAQRALGNIRGNIGNNIGRTKASGKPVKGAPSQNGNLPQKKPDKVNTAVGPVTPPPQQVSVNPVGQLQLPYDSTLMLDSMAAQKEHDDALYQLQLEEQQMLAEVTQGRRDADINFKNMNQFNLDANSASGTAYSSMYGKAVADTATEYSTTLADLQRRESDFTQQAAGRRASIAATLSQQLAAASQAYQERLSQQVVEGEDFGYGDYNGEDHAHEDNDQAYGNSGNKGNKPKPKPNKPKPKPGPSGGGPSNHNPVKNNGGGGGKGKGKK